MRRRNPNTKSSDFYLENPVGQVIFTVTAVFFIALAAGLMVAVTLVEWILSLFDTSEN